MGIERFFVHDVTILRGSANTDEWGDATDWSDPAETSTHGWVAVRNNTSDPNQPNRDVDVSQWVAMLPAYTDLTESDRLRVEMHGRTYLFDIEGHVAPGSTPEGLHHIEANLRLVEG